MSYFVLHEGMPYWKVDWSHRREHVAEKGLTVDQANEALEDPERLVIGPDPRSVTGDSHLYGATAWRANRHGLRLYRGGERI